ncbi:MAG: stage V sporulation protein AD [Candidatus Merdivicinus sp.]|jgi:stage V sporulation protein AD
MAKRFSRNTILLESCPSIEGWAAVGGKKEGEGPLAAEFDIINPDTSFGESTWEKAESRMQRNAVDQALSKAKVAPSEVDIIFAGDLLNQCVGSTYGLRELGIPFLGMYGACSTMAESLAMASLFIEGGISNRTAATTSSHFCSAERQFRFPLEYGGQRTPTAQWTATAAGAVVVGKSAAAPYIRQVSIGTIVDLGITDAANMGAAMAPAAASTIAGFLKDTGMKPEKFDRIFTGDLGRVGSDLMLELLEREKIHISAQHADCGLLLFDRDTQDVHAGGSGCGCSASVLCAHILPRIASGEWKDVLFVATGALMSPTLVQQGESIPGIAHLIHISHTRGEADC